MRLAACLSLLLPGLAAATGPLRPDDAMLLHELPEGTRLEVRVDADLTGDGLEDVAFIARNEDARLLRVLVAYADEVNTGFDTLGELALDPNPLGDATLSVRRGVLVLEDLTGGTSAIASTHRFRYDPAEHRMRLIGEDLEFYSRTFAHDGLRLSTNRLTGQRIRQVLELTAEGDYAPRPEQREAVPRTPVWMEDTPEPAAELGLGPAG